MDFKGRVALVTGGGRGLGFAYAKGLAQRGAFVVVQDVGADVNGLGQDPHVARTAMQRLRTEGGRASAETAPIANREDCAALVGRILDEHGTLDIVIHNAGWVGYRTIEDLKPEFLREMIGLGIETPLWIAQAAWPSMRRRRFGRILLTTSDRAIYSRYAQPGLASYAAAKMATVGMVNVLSCEGEPDGILVNAISPVAKTRMWGVEEEPVDLKPEAVAHGALYLVSAESRASGWVMRAADGQFVASRSAEAASVDYPRDLKGVTASSAEEVARLWPQIAVVSAEAR